MNDCADILDVAVEKVANTVRDTLSSSPWIPDSIRPAPHAVYIPVSDPPATTLERIQDWIFRHKLVTGVVIIATGTISYRMYRSSQSRHKTRRARKSRRNGGRMDVVIIAGSPALPLTRSLAMDMERKGFIVFVICNSVEDENVVQHMSRPDVRPLSIDVTDVSCFKRISQTRKTLTKLPSPQVQTRPSTDLRCTSKHHTFPYPWPNRTTYRSKPSSSYRLSTIRPLLSLLSHQAGSPMSSTPIFCTLS
jgi:uncharacterized protein DUF1776